MKSTNYFSLFFVVTIALLLSSGLTTAQPGAQSPPVYTYSKSPNFTTTGDVQGLFLGSGVPTTNYNAFDIDKGIFYIISNVGGSSEPSTVDPLFQTLRFSGSTTTDIRQITASASSLSSGCGDFTPTFEAGQLIVDNATADFTEYNGAACRLSSNFWRSYLASPLIRSGIALNNGHLIATTNSKLGVGNPFTFDVTGTDNQYRFLSSPGNTGKLSLSLDSGARLVMGADLTGAALVSSASSSSNSSLNMKPGSSLTLNNTLLTLVGDVNGAGSAGGFAESSINGSAINLTGSLVTSGTGINASELHLSVANVADSTISFSSGTTSLLASRLKFSGNNLVLGWEDAKIANRSRGQLVRMTEFSVMGGKTTVNCTVNCSAAPLHVATEEIVVGSGGELVLGGNVLFDPAAIRAVKVSGGSTLTPKTNFLGTELAQNYFLDVDTTSTLRLNNDLNLRCDQCSLFNLRGSTNFTGSPASSESKLLIEAASEASVSYQDGQIRARLNPTGWTQDVGNGLILADYSDAMQLAIKGNGGITARKLDSAEVVVEAYAAGLSATDFVSQGFDDSTYGKGTYNIITGTQGDLGNWPAIDDNGRPKVVLGASMPAGLVAQVTRDLADAEIPTQPAFPSSKLRVLQIQLSLAQGPLALVYPDAIGNAEQTTSVVPTVTNAAGTMSYTFVDITPVSGASYGGTISVDSSGTLSLTPIATDGAECLAGNIGGRNFTVRVVAERKDLPDPNAAALASFNIQVCNAASSITPYISYTGFLDADLVPVGTAINKKPFVSAGFTPTTFAVETGTLPAGLTLNAATGEISGTPTAAVNGGDAAVTIKAVEGGTEALDSIYLPIDPVLTYTNSETEIGQPFSAPATKSPYQGTESPVFRLTSPPAGWSINTTTGEISATPDTFGDVNLNVEYEAGPLGSAAENIAKASLHVKVTGDPITVSYPSLSLNAGEAVSLTPTLTNDRDTVTFSVPGGLPAGWVISNSGVITGVMPKSNSPTFLVEAKDKYTQGGTSITVAQLPPAMTTITGGPGGLSAVMSVQGCSNIASASFVPAPDSPSKPTGYNFPFGLLDFSLNSCNSLLQGITVTVDYSQPLPAGARFFKEESGVYSGYSAQLGDSTTTFLLTDNGEGDDDPVPGEVRDPSGIGVQIQVPAPVAVPAMPLQLLWALASCVGLLGIHRLRARKGGEE